MKREPDPQHVFSGTLLILFAILCFSILPPLVRIGLMEDVGPIPLLALRQAVATAFLWVVFGLTARRVLRIDARGFLACTLVAGTETVAALGYYHAFTHISASIAHVTFSTYPVLALILLSIRGERFSFLQFVGLALALTGVFLLVGPGGRVNPTGTALALVGGMGYAGTLAFTQWFLSEYDPRTVGLYVVSMMTVMMGGVWAVQWQGLPVISGVGWSVIVVAGIVSTALARVSLFAGIRRAGSGRTALLAPVETLLAVTWSVLFLGDRLSALQWAGGILVIVSMNLVMRRTSGPPFPPRRRKGPGGRWRSLFWDWI